MPESEAEVFQSGDNDDDVWEEILNPQLAAVLDFYDCADFLPYANHILWLNAVKEALGHIPFSLDYFDICCLVILQEEINKKAALETQKTAERSRAIETPVTPRLHR